MNGLGRLRVSASSREEQQRTKPQGTRGGVLGVNGEGPLKGTHTLPYLYIYFRYFHTGVVNEASQRCC